MERATRSGATYYQVVSAIGAGAVVVLAAGAAVIAWQLRALERGWNRYVDFLEPPSTAEEIRTATLAMNKSTEERARELDGRVPGTPLAALEETDRGRAWEVGDDDEVV